MPHRLTAVFADVGDYTVAVFKAELLRYTRGGKNKASRKPGVLVRKHIRTLDMLFGNNENMHGRLRINILKSDYFIIGIYLFGRYFIVNYFAKQTIFIYLSPVFT